MPLQKLIFKPGVNREGTTLTNEGSWFETDKVRFRSGFPEKIGGWVALSANTFLGVCRSLWNWITLKNYNLLGVGTNQKFYVENGGNYFDITPIAGSGTVSTIDVVDGSYVATFTLSLAYTFQSGDLVNISGVTGTIGGIPAEVFNQQYEVSYISGTSFSVRLREVSPIESPLAYYPATADDSASVSAAVDFLLGVGLPIYTVGTGWGVGGWNANPLGLDTDAWAHGWGTGFTVGGSGVGAGLQMRLWSQSNFGEELLINPRGGSIYVWAPGSSPTPDFNSRAQIIDDANAPLQANEVLVSDATRIVIAFGCNNYSPPLGDGVFDPMLIRWTTNESYNIWTPDVTNQAGSYRLSHGSEIISAMQTRQEILVWTDAALYSMQYLGPPYIWGFNILADNISMIGPNAVATANGMVFWMGTDKFYMYSGRVETMPSSLRNFVFQDFNKDQAYQTFACTNEGYSEVWWFYCSANSNMIDRYVVYNYLDQVWYYGAMQRTAWVDSAIRQYPQATASVQSTLVALTPVSATATEINVSDTSSFPNSGYIRIDDEIIYYGQNNNATLTNCVRGLFDTTAAPHAIDSIVTQYGGNVVVFHEYGNDDASTSYTRPIESYIQSSDIDLDDGDRYMFVWQMVPDFSFDGSTSSKPEIQVQLRPRQNPGAPYGSGASPTVDSAQNYSQQNTYTVQEFTELVNTRIRGRQVALRITSSTVGTKWQLGAMRINMRADGRR